MPYNIVVEVIDVKNIIEIKDLSKSYGNIRAVDGISFCVKEGELFAFLGVNGAGKSTTISIMCNTLKKDSGSILIDGFDAEEEADRVKSKIGVVFQNSVLDKALTVKDNLRYRASLYGIFGKDLEERLKWLSSILDLGDIFDRAVGKLSGGQRRRVDIARAVLHKPKILILDEPTTGLDPQTRAKLWRVIDDMRKSGGMTVLLTTHYMEEAADADNVVILDNGRIVAEGTPHQLKNAFTGDYITIRGISEEVIRGWEKPYELLKDAIRITVANTSEATALIVKYPHLFIDYEITKANMDDVFLAATGKTLSDSEREEGVAR